MQRSCNGRGTASPRAGSEATERPLDFREMETSPTPADDRAAAPAFHSLTLVLPAFNEAERIGPALDDLFGFLGSADGAERLPPHLRVLVVDDGSTDMTAHLVLDRPEAAFPEDASLRLELLRVPHGGKGAAVRAGMLAATGEVVIFSDADMATP